MKKISATKTLMMTSAALALTSIIDANAMMKRMAPQQEKQYDKPQRQLAFKTIGSSQQSTPKASCQSEQVTFKLVPPLDANKVTQACSSGNIKNVQQELKKLKKDDVNKQDSNGMNPLMYASANGYIDVVKYLVESCGADILVPTGPLHDNAITIAAKYKQFPIARYLLQQVKESQKELYFSHALVIAVGNGDEAFYDLLTTNFRVNPGQIDSLGNDLLTNVLQNWQHFKINKRLQEIRLKIFQKILKEYPLLIKHRDREGKTSCQRAVTLESPSLVKIYLASGVDVAEKDPDGYYLLKDFFSIGSKLCYEVLKVLLDEYTRKGICKEVVNHHPYDPNNRPIYNALYKGLENHSNLLIEYGADVSGHIAPQLISLKGLESTRRFLEEKNQRKDGASAAINARQEQLPLQVNFDFYSALPDDCAYFFRSDRRVSLQYC